MATLDKVYRDFGKAAEHAQNFESALGSVLLVYEIFESEAKAEPNFDPYYYKDILNKIDRNTLGVLMRKVSERITVKSDITETFEVALKARNYLAHNFYRDQGLSIETETGRDAMVSRLVEIQSQLSTAQEAAELFLRSFIKGQESSPKDSKSVAQQGATADPKNATRFRAG